MKKNLFPSFCLFSALFLVLLLSGSAAMAAGRKNIVPITSLLLGNSQVARTTVQEGVITVDKAVAGENLSVIEDGTDDTVLHLQGDLAGSVQPGKTLYVLPGADDRFPLGFAGRVQTVTDNPDGSKNVGLEPVSYADVFAEEDTNLDDIILDADNFVGVISPAAVQAAGSSAKSAKAARPGVYSFRNGAIVVRRSGGGIGKRDTISPTGTVSLNMKVDLADMGGLESSTMQPADAETSVGFVISGELDNIKITKEIKFSKTKGLKELELRLDGDLDFDVKFNGKGSVRFGYFSQAWNEVKDAGVELFGVEGKLYGLSTDDKIGKFPLAGLVWSVAWPNTCPVITGQTQTPLRQAKVLGVIVWLYLDLDGELTLDGELSLAKLNNGDLSLGVQKSSTGKLQMIKSLEPKSGTGRFFEAPRLNGTLGLALFGGISADVDFFTGGLYIANAGLDLGVRGSTEIEGNLSYGTSRFGDPWSWLGSACFTANYGAGAVFRAGARFGVKIDTAWKKVSTDFAYEWQLPTDEEMDDPGWHGLWYTAGGVYECWPKLPPGSGSGSLNDTGITLSGNYKSGNNSACVGSDQPDGSNVYTAQDCSHGRDTTHNDDSDGHAGFSFTKISTTGQELPASATSWSCVKDNVTGLIWEVKTDDGGLHDKDDSYTWYNTDSAANGGAAGYADEGGYTCYGYDSGDAAAFCNTQAYVARVNAAGWCGATDWRMPTIKELESLVSFDRYSPAIDTDFFPRTNSSNFWSGSPGAYGSNGAWYVYFNNGYSFDDYRDGSGQVRLVRGGQ